MALEPFVNLNPAFADLHGIPLLYPTGFRPGNVAFYHILSRYFRFEPRKDYFQLFEAAELMAGDRPVNKLYWEDEGYCQCQFINRILSEDRKPVFYSLTEDETARGKAIQARLGIPEEAPFVCVHNREPGYIRMPHHNHRNADIMSLQPGIDYLLEQGYHVVRIGDSTMTPLPQRAGLIDLPFAGIEDDLSTIWFATRCRFMVANTSGPCLLPTVFNGPPRLLVNWIEGPTMSFNPLDRYIVKPIQVNGQGDRWLTFGEKMFFGVKMLSAHKYQRAGLNVIDNSPEELLVAVRQMVQDVNDNHPVDTSTELQRKYQHIALEWHKIKTIQGEGEPCHLFGPPVCNTFLEKYPEMLNMDEMPFLGQSSPQNHTHFQPLSFKVKELKKEPAFR